MADRCHRLASDNSCPYLVPVGFVIRQVLHRLRPVLPSSRIPTRRLRLNLGASEN